MTIYRIFTVMTIFFFTSSLFCTAQEKTSKKINIVRLQLEGRRYDSLNLRLIIDGNTIEYIKGSSSDNGYNWEFSYHDSISYYMYAGFIVPENMDSIAHNLAFRLVQGNDTIKNDNYTNRFCQPLSLINAHYLNTDTSYDIPAIREGAEIMITLFSDNYEISTDDDELLSCIKAWSLRYSWLPDAFCYEENIQHDIELTQQYPNSRSLSFLLDNNKYSYNSKADVAKIFNYFSEENKQSYYGQKINKYLIQVDTIFTNQKLITWNTGLLEYIVQDSSKFNLIIFSASWCAPCVKMIPLLKEIYQDLGHDLIMTYVSIDEEESAESWREKMRTHEIPWRSLMALDKSKEIHDRSIPYIILVHPKTMYCESLDVRKDEDKQRLYELLR